jgi:hypothetical protein
LPSAITTIFNANLLILRGSVANLGLISYIYREFPLKASQEMLL